MTRPDEWDDDSVEFRRWIMSRRQGYTTEHTEQTHPVVKEMRRWALIACLVLGALFLLGILGTMDCG